MQTELDWMIEWVVFDPGNWHLKPDAPEEIVKEFQLYMKDN